MKLLWVAAPILALAVYVLVRAVRGRPLSRFTLNVVVALYLLGYVLTTAALGVFWVARMDLPAFDWHYLFGYCVVLLVVVHVAFQLRVLGAFFRRVSPAALLVADRSRFRSGVARVALVSIALVLLAPVAWLLREGLSTPGARVARYEVASHDAGARASRVVVLNDGRRLDAIEFMHEQSSYSRSGVLREPSVSVRQEPPVKIQKAPALELPAPRPSVGHTLAQALASSANAGSAWSAERIELGTLAEILHYTAGVTDRKAESAGLLLRAAASSGALFPTDLYVVARSVERVPAGVHYYDPHRHALIRVGEEALLSAFAASTSDPTFWSHVGVAFVLAVTFDRTVFKYGVRSYRYVALDTGHLTANLLLATRALGLHCTLEPSFDDARIGRALGVSAESEGVLLAIGCSAALSAPASAAKAAVAHGAEWIELPAGAELMELTRLSHLLTSWRLLPSEPGRPIPAPLERAKPAESIGVAEAPGVDRDLFEVIAGRRSYREFAASPITLFELSGVIQDATAMAHAVRGVKWLDLYVFVRAVEGVRPGVYRHHAEAGLELLATGDFSARVASAGLSQELLERAAVVLAWALGERVGHVDGARDYRSACMDAGIAGQATYLSASGRGLGVCGVGAFYDSELGELIRPGASPPRVVYLQAIGRR